MSREPASSGFMLEAHAKPDPLAPMLARNAGHREMLLRRAGGALSAKEVARLLGIAPEAVDERRRTGTLLAVREGSDWRYPACQFQPGGIIPGLTDVLRGLAAASRWVMLDFLLAPDTVLEGRTPLRALRAGDHGEVLRLVRASQGNGFA